jgi:CheY-like chemotaxis protein
MTSVARRALVVEDDAAIRQLLRTVLGREGFEVEVAADGLEALARLRSDAFHLIVLDLILPAVSGHAVLDYLRQERPVSLQRVVVITAAPHLIRHGLSDDVCRLLRKPFHLEEFIAAIHDCVA